MVSSNEEYRDEDSKPKAETGTGKRKEPPRYADEEDSQSAADEVDENPIEPRETSDSERKRIRERKRREEETRGLDQLMHLIFMINPELKAAAEKNYGKSQRSGPEATLSRVEIINTATVILQRIYRENEERKEVVSLLSRELLNGRGGGVDQGRVGAVPPPNVAGGFGANPFPPAFPLRAGGEDIQQAISGLPQQQQVGVASLAAFQQALQNSLSQAYLTSPMGPSGTRGVPAPRGLLNRGSQLGNRPFASEGGAIPAESTFPGSASFPTENVSLLLELQRGGLFGIQENIVAPCLPGASGRSAASMMSSVAAPATSNPADIPGRVAESDSTNAYPVGVEGAFHLSDEIIRQAMMRDEANRRW